jgi:uncharacterized protein
MKFLLLFFIFMVLLWQWRQARQPKVMQAKRKSAPGTAALDMVQCAHCGVHLPANDAIPGGKRDKAVYCSAAHRQAQEP